MLILLCFVPAFSAALQVVGASLALAGLSYPASRFWYTHNWRKINQNKIFEHKMLRWVARHGSASLRHVLINRLQFSSQQCWWSYWSAGSWLLQI
jgi:hypothetical protein